MIENEMVEPAEQPKMIDREAPEPEKNVGAAVKEWLDKLAAAEKHWEKAFKAMSVDMEYAYRGCDPALWDSEELYTVPIIGRHINQQVATLYAKNPRAVAKRKPRLEYALWDGRVESLTQAMQNVQAAQGPQIDPATGGLIPQAQLDPNAVALIQDFEQGEARKKMLDRLGKTLEILFNYYTSEQEPNFKKQMKQLVRRTKICGVGYVTLGFQRLTEKNPDITTEIADMQRQLEVIERMAADIADGEVTEPAADIARLQQALAALQEQETVLVREGLTFGFPRSNEILPDPQTKALNGWIGAGWVAEVFNMTANRIKEVYKKDVEGAHTVYREGVRSDLNTAAVSRATGDCQKDLAKVYRVYDKETGTVFTLCEGYKDYLDPPASPKLKLERFFPIFALTFNDVEHEKAIIPPSDVYWLRHPQKEYNASRQSLTEHRQANRPMYVAPAGKLSVEDKEKLKNRKAHDVLELNAVDGQTKATDLFEAVKFAAIDPNLYSTTSAMEDVLRSTGSQEANLGGTSGASATESSIAEASRSSSSSSNVDDLDEFLSELARNSSVVLLMEMNPQSVIEIVGPGAVWPEMDRESIVKELYLDIKAGSSGRPNKSMELANLERGMPFLLQIPGLNPTPLARKYGDLLELDLDEMMAEGLPSIVAMNAMAGKQAQVGTGDPASDPNQQGGKGGENAPKAAGSDDGPQPEYPGPQGGMSKILTYDASGNLVG